MMTMYKLPLFSDLERPKQQRLRDQIAFGKKPVFITVVFPRPIGDYNKPWKNVRARDVGTTIKEDKKKFHVIVDVQHFAPEEISVKVVDGFLMIDAKHEEKVDQRGFVSRSFTRKYELPEGIDANTVTSKLSSDGVLSITAPLKLTQNDNEIVVPITRTGPVKKQQKAKTGKGQG